MASVRWNLRLLFIYIIQKGVNNFSIYDTLVVKSFPIILETSVENTFCIIFPNVFYGERE